MPFYFSLIPEHIRISIAKKQQLTDFQKFHESSRIAFALAGKMKKTFLHRVNILKVEETEKKSLAVSFALFDKVSLKYYSLPLDFYEDIPVRCEAKYFYISCDLSDKVCDWFKNFISATSSYCIRLNLMNVTCSLDNLNYLIKSSKAKECTFHGETTSLNYLTIPAIENMKLSVHGLLNDETLMFLKGSFLILRDTNISSYGINSLLKQRSNNERSIETIHIKTSHRLDKNVIFDRIAHTRHLNAGKEIYVIGDINIGYLTVEFENDGCVSIEEPKRSEYYDNCA